MDSEFEWIHSAPLRQVFALDPASQSHRDWPSSGQGAARLVSDGTAKDIACQCLLAHWHDLSALISDLNSSSSWPRYHDSECHDQPEHKNIIP